MLNVTKASTVPVRETHRLDYLDGLRALAAIFVVMAHCGLEIWPRGRASAPHWTGWLYFAHVAVDLFIVLSGFCLMLPVVRGDGILRGGAFTFFKKRARRILPPYYFALALSLLLIFTLIGKTSGTHWDISLPVTWRSFVIHLLLLQNFTYTESLKINHVFWSISLEWWIYFLFPALVWAWKRFGAGATTLLSIAASYALCEVSTHFFHQAFTLWYIALFVLGMMASEFVHTRHAGIRHLRDHLPWELLTWCATGLALLAINDKIPFFKGVFRSDALVGLWAMCLLVTLGIRQNNILGRALSQKTIVFLGSFAYSIYLIHAPLVQIIWQYILHPLHLAPLPTFLILEGVGIPAMIVCAYLFFLGCEKPFMNLPGKPALKTERQVEAAAIVNPAP